MLFGYYGDTGRPYFQNVYCMSECIELVCRSIAYVGQLSPEFRSFVLRLILKWWQGYISLCIIRTNKISPEIPVLADVSLLSWHVYKVMCMGNHMKIVTDRRIIINDHINRRNRSKKQTNSEFSYACFTPEISCNDFFRGMLFKTNSNCLDLFAGLPVDTCFYLHLIRLIEWCSGELRHT